MKKFLIAVIALIMTVGTLSAQYMYIWNKDGTYLSIPINSFDSIGFYMPENIGGDDNININDGMYIVGEATGYANLKTEGVEATGMAQNPSYSSESMRNGLYEKYLVLEADKDFQIVFKEGQTYTYYGAALEASQLATGSQELNGWKGALTQDAKMQVPATGFYHIILDLNLDGQLDADGGAQIIVTPVEWGLSGTMNEWAYIAADAQPAVQVQQTEITWTWTGLEFPAYSQFKFRHSDAWQIYLNDAASVQAFTNLGGDMIPGGNDITVEEEGVYQITLTYKMANGYIADNYSYTIEKTADIPTVVTDYSNVVLCVVGDAVAAQDGAETDPSLEEGGWGWGNRFSMGKPVKNGNVYTWTATLNLLSFYNYNYPSFKIRSYNTTDELYIDAGREGGGNIYITEKGLYIVTVTLSVGEEGNNVTVDVQPVDQIVTVRTKLPSDWTNIPTAWVWITNGEGSAVELVQDGDWWVYTTPEPVLNLNIIFRNGDDWDMGQSVDITGLTGTVCLQIAEDDFDNGNNKYYEISCE